MWETWKEVIVLLGLSALVCIGILWDNWWRMAMTTRRLLQLILIGIVCGIVGGAVGVILSHSPLLMYRLGWW